MPNHCTTICQLPCVSVPVSMAANQGDLYNSGSVVPLWGSATCMIPIWVEYGRCVCSISWRVWHNSNWYALGWITFRRVSSNHLVPALLLSLYNHLTDEVDGSSVTVEDCRLFVPSVRVQTGLINFGTIEPGGVLLFGKLQRKTWVDQIGNIQFLKLSLEHWGLYLFRSYFQSYCLVVELNFWVVAKWWIGNSKTNTYC